MDKAYGLLGRRLGHSWSPRIHGLLCGYEYKLYEVEPEALGAFLAETPLAGMNVTIPYKRDVLPCCATLSDAARRIGSVNTLVRTEAGWHGDNTDCAGFITMARQSGVPIEGRKALVLGTGGASLAVKEALRQLGAGEIVSISRSGPDNYENLHRHADAQVIVNTTPVGMYPDADAAPVSLDAFPRCEGVLDIVYNPMRTRLVMDAEGRGLPCAGGLSMLVSQAWRSAELFIGGPIDDARAEAALRAVAGQMRNIVLIGMPGCGKTTVGRLLAARTGRPLYDADETVAARAGRPVPDILREEGEDAFRRQETEALGALGLGTGGIIATGGGCVTRAENYPLLHRNSVIVWLRRRLDALPTEGRPLSERDGVAALYEARKPLYEAFSDLIVDNDGAPAAAADRIIQALGL